jgi:hypothetical protein
MYYLTGIIVYTVLLVVFGAIDRNDLKRFLDTVRHRA